MSSNTADNKQMGAVSSAMPSAQIKKQLDNNKTTAGASISVFPWRRLVAGAVAGTADVWTCHGLDRVKTQMQNQPGSTMRSSFQQIWSKGGIRALYEGILPMTTEAVFKVGCRYFTFEWWTQQWKTFVMKDADAKNIPFEGRMLGGFFAGTVESYLIVIPCELLKIRHMTGVHQPFINVVKDTIREEGISALYKGGTATWLRQVTNHMIRFPCFFGASQYLKEQRGVEQLNPVTNLMLGGSVGAFSTLCNTPLDCLKTQMQSAGQQSSSTLAVARKIVAENGIFGLWSGVTPRIARVAPGQAITWMVFEQVSQFLDQRFPKSKSPTTTS